MTVSRACWRVNHVFTYFLDYSVYLANNFSRQILTAWLVVIYQCPNRNKVTNNVYITWWYYHLIKEVDNKCNKMEVCVTKLLK